MQRYGLTASATYGQIDNLTMTYAGNQMKTVSDAAADIALNTSMDFKNYSNVAAEYTYNKNGAMSQDLNKGISSISYNSLNLPRMVDIKNKTTEGRNEYTYSASGVKLKAVQKWNPNYSTAPVIGSTINTAALTQSQTTDYVGNIIYENNTLKRILVDGGYNESGNYYFYIQDHLGNNRIVANAAASVVQSTQYYPFGISFADATAAGTQPYKYNGKELDARNGLNMYDYSARWKDDFRFTTVDPHAENYYSWSPYAYVGNNPLKYIDPTGMDWVTDKDNNIIWNDQATSAKNTPKGYTYIGNDNALLSHIGMAYDFPDKRSESPGQVALDENVGMQSGRVRETSNVKMGVSTQNVKDNISKSNESGKTFTGVSVTVRDKTVATVVDGDLSSSSRVEVKYGDKTYSKAMQELPSSPNGDIKEYGANYTIASIVIPASDINSSKHISSVQVSGTWWVTKPEGRTPVVYHGLIPVPVKFTNSWTIRK